MGFWIFIAVIVAIAAWAVTIYNGLVTLRNRFKNAFAQIDVQLKRRYDLIPNLVETVKGYMKHEATTLEAVIKARNMAYTASQAAAQAPGDPNAMQSLANAEGQLSAGLGRLLALSESYPDLKANTNMRDLSEELIRKQLAKDPFALALRLYEFHMVAGNKKEGFKHLQEAEKLKPDDGKVQDLMFQYYVGEQNWDKANEYVDKLAAKSMDQAGGLIYRYRLAMTRGDVDSAMEFGRQLTTKLDQFARSWVRRRRCLCGSPRRTGRSAGGMSRSRLGWRAC